MMVQEVSLVNQAANLRKFVLVKRDDMTTPTQATTKMTLKLPSAAQQGLMDGLAQVLDKLTALATMVGDAEKDDTASVPTELTTALNQVSEMIEGMSSQYGAPPPDETAAAPSAPGTEAAGTPPATPPAPEAGKALDPAAKNLPPECKDGSSFKQELHDGDSLAQLLHKGIALAHTELATVDKAGRKMAGARYKKLSELHDSLGKLLNELAFDEASAAEAGKAGTEKIAKADESQLTELVKRANETIETLKKRLGEVEGTVAQVAKSTVPSNGGPLEGSGAPSEVKWGFDMSAEVAKKKAAGRK